MPRSLAVAGALLAAIGVLAGAFGAHALKSIVPPADLVIWETAVRYQLFHALALLVLGLQHNPRLAPPALVMVPGVLVFSGSLYLLVLTNTRWLGAVTPFGGTLLIFAWLLLAWRLWRSDR